MKHSKTSSKKYLTIQILTHNNAETIQRTLQSILPFNLPIAIADTGSNDRTIAICKRFGIEPIIIKNHNRSWLRNYLTEQSSTEWNFYIEPWEFFIQGNLHLENYDNFYVSIMHDNILSKEVRFWTKEQKFIYPVFERVDCSSVSETDIILCSRGRQDYQLALQEIEIWKNNNPMLATPYYYEGLILLALGQYEEFMIVAERFMYMNNKESMASTMNRYYYALVTLISKKKIKPVLQNINLCICHKPIMPEFWCLMGDAYYHLQGDFQLAMSFYENAIELGKYRLKTDKWPMDISKYKAYPEKMIDSCKKIIDNQGTFKIPNHL